MGFFGASADALAKSPDRELVHLAGDMDHGLTSTIKLGSGKQEVKVTYKGEFVLTVDVFALPNEPLCVHLICPKCRHALRVSADRKAIDFDPTRNLSAGGDLSIEPFECTWEMQDAGEHVQGLIAGGITLCRWKAAIDHNVARDA